MKHLIKQTFVLTASNVITRVLGMLFFIILARALSVSDYGLFRYLITISFMYGILFTGIPTALTKFIGEDKSNKKRIAQYLSNTVILMIAAFFILCIPILIFNANKFYLILFLFAVLVDTLYLGFIRGIINIKKLAGFKLFENIIQIVILSISYIIFRQVNFTFAVVFFSFSAFLSMIIFELISPQLKFVLKFSKEKIKQLTRYAIPVMLGSIGWTVMFGINEIFIKYFYNTEQVGYYSVGVTLAQAFTFLPMAIATIIMPKAAGIKDKLKIIRPLGLAVIGTLLVSAIGLVLLIILKKPILLLIFGEKYLPALVVILPLSLGQISIAIHQIYAALWQGLNRPSIPTINISIAALLNVIGSYFLTKSYGIVGTSISNAITSFIALISIVILFYSKWKTLSK